MIVLDEFQYLADGRQGIAAVASELNAVWEELDRRYPVPSGRRAAKTGKAALPFGVVLAGSAVSTVEALTSGGAPLYGRFAWHGVLKPFTYWHAAELAPFAAHRDRALLFGIFGGTPRHLAAMDPARPLRANVESLLLSPRGEVRLLVETALDQEEGLRDVGRYRAILRAVAAGGTVRNEIAQRTGLPNDNALRVSLSTLIELGYLEERRNVDARTNEPVRYAIADPAFLFYHRFVLPNASVLERYPAQEVWTSAVAPSLDAYMDSSWSASSPRRTTAGQGHSACRSSSGGDAGKVSTVRAGRSRWTSWPRSWTAE